jgi:hypothetical protein
MGKKKALIILKGSLKTHWIRYITTLNMDVNPADMHGNNQALGIIRMLNTMQSKFLQPGFAYTYNQVKNKGVYHPTIMNVKFVNGYERRYNLGLSTMDSIKTEINFINDMVEFERSSNGQDDELEDEA